METKISEMSVDEKAALYAALHADLNDPRLKKMLAAKQNYRAARENLQVLTWLMQGAMRRMSESANDTREEAQAMCTLLDSLKKTISDLYTSVARTGIREDRNASAMK